MPKKRKRTTVDREEDSPQGEDKTEGESEPALQEEMTTEYLSLLESMKSTDQAEDENSGEEKMEEEASSDQNESNGSSKEQGKAMKSSGEPPKTKSPFENAFLSFIGDESSDVDDKAANGKSFFDLEEEEDGEDSSSKDKGKKTIDLRPRRMSSRQAAQKARTALKDHDSEDSDSDGADPIERQKESSILKATADSTGTTETKPDATGLARRGKQVGRKRRAKRRHSEVDDDDNDPEWNPTQEKSPTSRLDMPGRNSSGNTAQTATSSDEDISDDADMRRGPGRPGNSEKKRPLQPPKVVIYPNKVVKTTVSSSASGHKYTTILPNNTGGRQEPTSSNVVSSSVGSSNDMINDDPLIISDAESESEEDTRMNYLRDEFVVNTEHLSDDNHPIWQIQKTLLKKFVPYQDKKHWYIASNSYLGWFGSEKSKFRPVRCRFVRKERNADIVKVVKPRRSANNAGAEAAPDTTNEVQTSQQSLADSFKIYLQAAVSQVLDDEFLPCVEEERDEFFLTALSSLDERLEEAKRAVADNLGWLPRFRTLAETWPFLREEEGEPATGILCQACEKQGHVAAKLLRLDGRPYDRLTLQDKETPSTSAEQEQLLKLGRVCGERLILYHRLHHYRFQLYRRCMAKVATLQEEHPEYPQEEVVRQILRNITWVKQLYEELRSLLEDCQAVMS